MTELKYFAGYALAADASAWFAVGIGALLLLTGAAYFVTLLIVAVRKKRNGDYELKNYEKTADIHIISDTGHGLCQ